MQPCLQELCLQQWLTLSHARFMTSAIALRASLVSVGSCAGVLGHLQAHKDMLHGLDPQVVHLGSQSLVLMLIWLLEALRGLRSILVSNAETLGG